MHTKTSGKTTLHTKRQKALRSVFIYEITQPIILFWNNEVDSTNPGKISALFFGFFLSKYVAARSFQKSLSLLFYRISDMLYYAKQETRLFAKYNW